jgi:Tetratricopeptide repeat
MITKCRWSTKRPDEWPDLLATLRSRPDHPITQALTTPLNVWLLRKTYIDTGKNPSGLLDTARYRTQYDITNHLLDNLVRALFAATGKPRSANSNRPFRPRTSREPADASRWLAFLARHVQAQNGQDLAWWHLNHSLATYRQNFIDRVVSKTGPGYGLVYGLGFVLFILLGNYAGGVHGPSLVRTLVDFLAAGVIGAILGLVGRKRKSAARGAGTVIDAITNLETVPSYVNFRSLSQGHVRGWISLGLGFLRVAFITGLLIGFSGGVTGAFAGAVLWWTRSHTHWHASGLATSILLGSVMFFAGFFVAWFLSISMSFLIYLAKTPLTDDQPQTPATALRRDLQLAGVSFLAAGLPAVLLTAPMVAISALAYGFRGAIVAGILFTCVPVGWGLFWVKDGASVWYLVTVSILRLERQVPRRLMAFLDDAHRVGLLRQVGAIYQFRHIILTDYFAPPSPQNLIARHTVAFSQARTGDPAAAIAVLEDLLADQERVLGPDHHDTLATRYYIGSWRAEAEDPAAAITALEDLLPDQERVLGHEHPDTLATRNDIAGMRAARGDHAEAEAGYRDVLAARLRTLGPDHPDTLATRHEIARILVERKDYAAALAEYRNVLSAELRVLGADHPGTLATSNWVNYLEVRVRRKA